MSQAKQYIAYYKIPRTAGSSRRMPWTRFRGCSVGVLDIVVNDHTLATDRASATVKPN